MAELVVGFHDEIYAENCILRHRSQENRKRCIALEKKIERLSEQIRELKQEKKRVQTECDKELADMEVRYAGAIDTIEVLREDAKRDKQQNFQLVQDCNDKQEQIYEFQHLIDAIKIHYNNAMDALLKSKQDVERLKEFNTTVLLELKRLKQ